MLAVSDSTPLIHLAKINKIIYLQKLFKKIFIPKEIYSEIIKGKEQGKKEIRSSLNIPKASFSRYLLNLEKKKLIIREGEGKNKVVKLK